MSESWRTKRWIFFLTDKLDPVIRTLLAQACSAVLLLMRPTVSENNFLAFEQLKCTAVQQTQAGNSPMLSSVHIPGAAPRHGHRAAQKCASLGTGGLSQCRDLQSQSSHYATPVSTISMRDRALGVVLDPQLLLSTP